MRIALIPLICWFLVPGLLAGQQEPAAKKVQVYILAGQSNMEGYGLIRSLETLGEKNPELLAMMKDAQGKWKSRDDVTIYWASKEKKQGPLDVQWGAMTGESIGPELAFGAVLGQASEAPVLLIKTAWGGKSVWCDFRSPGAGQMSAAEKKILQRDNHLRPGQFYKQMVDEIQYALHHLDEIVPGYQGQGYEMGGLAWLQGWNDFCEWHLEMEGQRVGMELIRQYPSNLAAMFKDLRNDLGQPGLPIVVGELGIGGPEMGRRARNQDDREAVAMIEFRRMQTDVASNPDLAPIQFVATEDCWDSRLQELRQASDEYWQEKQKQGIQDTEENHLPTKQQNDEFLRRGGHWYCHYNGSAMSYCLMGQRMAQQLLAMRAGPAKGAGKSSNQRVTNRGDQANRPTVAALDYQKIFMQNDADQDGRVSRAEAPERMRKGVAFNLIDTNLDGFIDRQELQVLHSKIMDRRSGR